MKNSTRILIAAAAIMLIALYFVPIWKINIDAPQFPDEVSMYIYINEIGGNEPNTLANINILNHYIGMQPIEPDEIPELEYMPYILGFLIAFGLTAAVINKRWLAITWAALLLVAGGLGMYDFYLWEYDYGHNLDPMAPIKVPGMSYQPPLIGTKVMLNITATSLPHIGGWLAVGSVVTIAIALFNEFKLKMRRTKKMEGSLQNA